MNILFLTLLDFESLQEKNIYTDLLREFIKNGHKVFAISPIERRKHQGTHIVEETNTKILRLQIGNIQKTNIIEKGISTLMIESTFKKGIKRYFSNAKFDLILYSTPPITLVGAIEYAKRRDNAKSYLLLKDIFPQNAVDIGMMDTKGIKGIMYKYFRKKEKKLYQLSDYIGCMSEANVKYLLCHNPEIDKHRVEICPNSIEVVDKSVGIEERKIIRQKYDIPCDKKVFVYGGNLGRPQGIQFLIECLRKSVQLQNVFFLIVGDGTEYDLLQSYLEKEKPENVKLMKSLQKEEYDILVGACDVGMIFLDHRFTIPNFPSRLLAYMQAKIPVLAVTDPNTDIGITITNGGFGWWCESKDVNDFYKTLQAILSSNCRDKGISGYAFLSRHYSVEEAYRVIMK